MEDKLERLEELENQLISRAMNYIAALDTALGGIEAQRARAQLISALLEAASRACEIRKLLGNSSGPVQSRAAEEAQRLRAQADALAEQARRES